MSDALETQLADDAGPVPPPKRKPGRPKKIRNEAALKAAQKKRFVSRRLKNLKADSDVEQIERLYEQFKAADDAKDTTPAQGDSSTPTAQNPPLEPQAIEEPTRPGWPSKSAIEAAKPDAEALWRMLGVFIQGTKYELTEQKISALVECSAPMLAKYGSAFALSPEFMFFTGIAAVFGQPFVEDFKAWLEKRKAARGVVELQKAA